MLHNGYYGYPSYRPTRHDLEALTRERERSEALAARRARRAQYLPPEDVDSGEEDLYRDGQPSQRERMYLEARRRQGALERLETERRKSETETFRRRMEQEGQRAVEKERKQTYKRSPGQASQKRSVPINMPGSLPRKFNNVTPPQTPIPPVVKYTQAHEDAAERIQKWYRRYQALKTIDDIAARFEQAKNELVFPESLDFVHPETPGDVITIPVVLALEAVDGDVAVEAVDNHPVAPATTAPSYFPLSFSTESHDYEVETTPSSSEDTSPSSEPDSSNEISTPQLAYTKRNYPIHAYMEKLNMLLMKLDSVLSYGSRKVRERRKEGARMIEKEAARIESVWKELGEGESAAVMDA